jgi:hypothetical protein
MDAFQTVEVFIKSGSLDSQLDQVEALVRARRARLADELMDTIVIGSRVQLNDRITPKYLAWSMWEVVGYPTDRRSAKYDLEIKPLDHAGISYMRKFSGPLSITKTLVGRVIES